MPVQSPELYSTCLFMHSMQRRQVCRTFGRRGGRMGGRGWRWGEGSSGGLLEGSVGLVRGSEVHNGFR